MAKSVKGVRINALAKELNVDSKAILEKLRAEGMGDAAPNHMSTIPLGLAETIKDWFHAGGGGTAIETAAPVDLATAVKPKTTRKRTTKKAAASTDQAAPAAAEAPSSPAEAAPPAPTAPSVAPVEPDASTTPARPSKSVKAAVKPTIQATVAAPPELTTPAVPEPPPVAPPSKSEAAPKAPAPAAEAPKPPSPPPPAPPAPAAHGSQGPSRSFSPAAPPLRPTVTLATRAPITPAPKLETLKPAQIQGPKIVRVEQPEVVATPRPRRPVTGEPVPAFTTARPQGGRGVRKSDEELDEIELKKGGSGKKGAGSLSARRRGVDGRRGEALEKLKEFTEADRYEREERLRAATASRATLDSHLKKSQARGTHAVAKTTIEKGQPITIEEPITVKSLSAALGVKASDIIGKLIKQGIFATINQSLDVDHAQALALEYGLELKVASRATLEEQLIAEFNSRRPDPSKLVPRPPVVTILGLVDHGKTSLLDRIRSANVAAQEAGGITQHTAAWMVTVGEKDRRKQVTFIDTPGHQAFTAMRARGANMTDVVVLVVGAVEGVMPQTIESINHARAAGVPIVVALSKTDRPDANPEMVLGQLAQHDLNPVEWGGQTEVIRTSAVTGQGINELIEILDLQAEILELKTDPTAPARGTVIEARIDPGLGPVATVLVQDGTLRVGDIVLAGSAFGRIRSILNDLGKPVSQATASMPVIISGLTGVPPAGEKFYVVNDLERARAIAAEREARSRQEQLAQQNRATAGSLLEQIAAGDVKTINLIIKADVQGSVETLVATVGAQNTEEVKVKVIHAGVGAITESDVQLASATKAKPTDNRVSIIGFHVVPEEAARILAEQHHVEIKLYRVIYEIFDDLKKALSGMLTKEVREKLHGHAEVRQVFRVSRLGNIAGCFITDGHVQRGSKVRLIRDGRVVAEDIAIESLRRVKDDVKEVKTGFECGIKLAGYDDIKQGDRFEFYVREEFERTL
ncbi:MAG: translation initiation factor IF-2 [Phycisphaerae bacterium]|nr:translation initiation factor IF-2 [Phycisphaerae bacterium]